MEKLTQTLHRINGRGYKAYKDIAGTYKGPDCTLHIDYVQGDPFASPSRIRVAVKREAEAGWLTTPWRRIAAEDFFARNVAEGIRRASVRVRGNGKSGLIAVDAPGQEVLQRTAVVITKDGIEVRLSVGLPAAGRSVLGHEAAKLLCEHAPGIVLKALRTYDRGRLQAHLELADQQQAIRRFLREQGYVAFVANGAVLPRESGVSNRPLKGRDVVPFASPPSLEVQIPLPHREPLRGMAVPQGVTLIVGGGYHGKSTLLKAVERGVYNHVPGDGREYVIADATACKIRAEDGRSIRKVDISPFIRNLPHGKDTVRFTSEDASGSTSQAANIMEALEAGARTLLIDEDTSATNFMIRDARMQRLVAKEKEPITPFVDKVRLLNEQHGVSTVLVLGGSGDYFHIADTVIMLDEYKPADVTEEARAIAAEVDTQREAEGGASFGSVTSRIIMPGSFDATRGRREKVDAKGLDRILYGTSEIDLTAVEQLVDSSQTRAIACMLTCTAGRYADGDTSIPSIIDKLYRLIEEKGLDAVSPHYGQHPGDLALPRGQELASALNRLRTLLVKG
ncbi:ABC-ATPase domain-containing protein [Paenibacillus sp. J5C_2022]|uniref:ABC-ATPase domain-containing protein n=1 Tax=Paenibacillus sp. J5C2022 TaxID=2977129 RepID=UPI0021CFFF84|nr:ABC-ATPase domain-containing protein [Paenibacillus sp. J5C2022]MCU6708607.1 ABC-ATPase domain-containing protein [Paenibacillus sp. J5C2022]